MKPIFKFSIHPTYVIKLRLKHEFLGIKKGKTILIFPFGVAGAGLEPATFGL